MKWNGSGVLKMCKMQRYVYISSLAFPPFRQSPFMSSRGGMHSLCSTLACHALDCVCHISRSISPSNDPTLTSLPPAETHLTRRRSFRSLSLQSRYIRFSPSNPDSHCSRQAVLRHMRRPASPLCRLHGSTRCRRSRPHSHRAPALQLYQCQRRIEECSVHWLELSYNCSRSIPRRF
jgi:hypothetical protein